MKAGSYLATLAVLGLCLAGRGALAQTQTQPQTPAQDWPCDQVLQPQLSIGSMWEGPDPTEAGKVWQNDEQVRALVARVAPRRVAIPDAKAEIHRFALAISADKQKILTEVFAGLFETINHDRSSIIHGIKRYHGRQEALAKDIEDKTAELDNLDPALHRPGRGPEACRHAERAELGDPDIRRPLAPAPRRLRAARAAGAAPLPALPCRDGRDGLLGDRRTAGG